ncbi:hypothetical protein LAJ19_04540 [Deinococcus taeanensis]|uniref:hypothetical protein n=1 Tax=Deinococcus taeanensis TaxID=2737050 RepID=UPI001CDC2AF3|nr:hypothetical protein [Deinococcus taeanensis]UBV43488.1 hypothetical protein LAJ19_04540 [Deinococcus taeanensis]
MNDRPAALLTRLDDIARALDRSGRAVALLGLGSVGHDLARLDQWSDLDFFVVARPGQTEWFSRQCDWLAGAAPLAYAFHNTPAGAKVLFEDGLYGEFAVFGVEQLPDLPYQNARLVWAAPDAPPDLPLKITLSGSAGPTARLSAAAHAHHLGEALTNLLVGVTRFQRGERLSALKFIQEYALGHVLALAAARAQSVPQGGDPFGLERRFERRYPELASALPAFAPGYDRSLDAALALLRHLETHEDVPAALAGAIRAAASA